jgi:endonuclease YncB( thermonuclease family)
MWLKGDEVLRPERWRIARKRRLPRLALIVVAAIAVAIVAAVFNPLPGELAGTATATDGDTLRLAGQRIRLAGLDAPELDQKCLDAEGHEWPCGIAAKKRLGALVTRTRIVCEPQDRDRYGRLIARCRANGADLGGQMVSEGLAVAEIGYAALALEAQQAKRGIWAGSFETPRTWRNRHQGFDPIGWVRSWFE